MDGDKQSQPTKQKINLKIKEIRYEKRYKCKHKNNNK